MRDHASDEQRIRRFVRRYLFSLPWFPCHFRRVILKLYFQYFLQKIIHPSIEFWRCHTIRENYSLKTILLDSSESWHFHFGYWKNKNLLAISLTFLELDRSFEFINYFCYRSSGISRSNLFDKTVVRIVNSRLKAVRYICFYLWQ